MGHRPSNATVLWAACLAGVMAGDVWFATHGQETLSEAARRYPWVTYPFIVLLTAHFAERLGRCDPFKVGVDCWDYWTRSKLRRSHRPVTRSI